MFAGNAGAAAWRAADFTDGSFERTGVFSEGSAVPKESEPRLGAGSVPERGAPENGTTGRAAAPGAPACTRTVWARTSIGAAAEWARREEDRRRARSLGMGGILAGTAGAG